MEYAVLSDQGLVRTRNEDRYLVDNLRGLFVVCDGMGGHKGGDVASASTVEVMSRCLTAAKEDLTMELLNYAILEANKDVFFKSKNNPDLSGMGTTVTAAAVKGQLLLVAHIGDSSLFVISNNIIKKITHDHTLAEQMIQESLITAAEAKISPYNHVLTRALGIERQVKIDNYEIKLQYGDMILLCSDGLTDLLNPDDILDTVKKEASLERTVQVLVSKALDRGGNDNVTVIIVSI